MDREQWASADVPITAIGDHNIPILARHMLMVVLALAPAGQSSCRVSMQTLAEACNIGSDHTVRQHLATLAKAEQLHVTPKRGPRPTYLAWNPAPKGKSVAVPLRLILNRSLQPLAKLLYAWLVQQPIGPRTQDELAAVLGVSARLAISRALTQLRADGWLHITPVAGKRIYQPHDSHLLARQDKAALFQELVQRTRPRGEFIMKLMLDELVTDEMFQDNARPGFLRSPQTGERMEFDRWYTEAKVAIEFNGIQHYRATKDFSEQQVRDQRTRDLAKEALATRKGIRLIILRGRDLTFDRLKAKLQGLLPLRELRTEDPVVQLLTAEGRQYGSGQPRRAGIDRPPTED